MAPPLSLKAAFGTWAGGLCQPPVLSWKIMSLFKCWCKDRKNLNAWKPSSRDCISCTPPKCESSGCPKTFSAICVLNLYSILFLIYICFALCFCTGIFCAFMFFFNWYFFQQLPFCLHFYDPFFYITCCIFSRFTISKINPPGADTNLTPCLNKCICGNNCNSYC